MNAGKFFKENFPAAIYVGTDGVDDSFGTDERLFVFYKRVTQTFSMEGFDGGKQELKNYLPKLTAKGSGDDISISGIVDMEAVRLLFPTNAVENQIETMVEGQAEDGVELDTNSIEETDKRENSND